MKKFLAVFLCFCMFALPVSATSVQLTMDSAEVVSSAQPGAVLKTEMIEAPTFTINGRTMVPVRAIAENFGAQVGWDDPVVTITKGDTVIQLTVDSTIASVNGQDATLDAAATVINGRTFVPLRFIGEAFGYTVKWIPSTQRILITDSPIVAKAGNTVMTFEELYFYTLVLSKTDQGMDMESLSGMLQTMCSVYEYLQTKGGLTEEMIATTQTVVSEMSSVERSHRVVPVINDATSEYISSMAMFLEDVSESASVEELMARYADYYFGMMFAVYTQEITPNVYHVSDEKALEIIANASADFKAGMDYQNIIEKYYLASSTMQMYKEGVIGAKELAILTTLEPNETSGPIAMDDGYKFFVRFASENPSVIELMREYFGAEGYNIACDACPAELLIDADTLEAMLAERGITFETVEEHFTPIK